MADDGVYSFDGARPTVQRGPRPTASELARLLLRISVRVAWPLERQRFLVRDHACLSLRPGEPYDQLVSASISNT